MARFDESDKLQLEPEDEQTLTDLTAEVLDQLVRDETGEWRILPDGTAEWVEPRSNTR
jgi:hypothetical protein